MIASERPMATAFSSSTSAGSSTAFTVKSRGAEGGRLCLPSSAKLSSRRGCAPYFQPALSTLDSAAVVPP